jgi:hypothetical protein
VTALAAYPVHDIEVQAARLEDALLPVYYQEDRP